MKEWIAPKALSHSGYGHWNAFFSCGNTEDVPLEVLFIGELGPARGAGDGVPPVTGDHVAGHLGGLDLLPAHFTVGVLVAKVPVVTVLLPVGEDHSALLADNV